MEPRQQTSETSQNSPKIWFRGGGALPPLISLPVAMPTTSQTSSRLIHPNHRPPDERPREDSDWSNFEVSARSHPHIYPAQLEDLRFIREKISAKPGGEHLGCWADYHRRYGYGEAAAVLTNSNYRDRREIALCGKRGSFITPPRSGKDSTKTNVTI